MARLDHERLARRTKAEILAEVEQVLDEVDAEHGRRLRMQADSLQSLLRGRTYEEEMAVLHLRIQDLERRLEQAQGELRTLRGQSRPLDPARML